MADPALHPETPSLHKTQPLKQIDIDYTPDACTHCTDSNTITVTFDHRGGARWHTPTRFLFGTFNALIQCPCGNTSGLNFNLYLSSLEGDKSQDEIDFEFLGKDMTIVQTNYYTEGAGNKKEIHNLCGISPLQNNLGFNCSKGFHEYVIKWRKDVIEWFIDGRMVRRVERKEGEGFPNKPMYLYSSVWDASYIDKGRWTGKYVGCDAPYVCVYKDIHVPVKSAVEG
ncbi:xyloglucan endotransglucosylase/hydrolase protein 4-like [Argentina anserina]|uniref:xyloglucan endotransglucosylase/hydrolase protein 4-like n=1 Tax=Argentina anserina TaxID=57926 RepID=UPI00217639AD|nr:xyloglucan endotransglucosylase/hydrolase protein 4-like [Potentilla anserina]